MTTRGIDPSEEGRQILAKAYPKLDEEIDRNPSGTTAGIYGNPDGTRRHCVVCCRTWRAPAAREGAGGVGGPLRRYCGQSCRQRGGDPRRRGLWREWRWCANEECPGLFLALDLGDSVTPGQVVCPPPWPQPVFGRSACWLARRRQTARDASRRARARRAATRSPEAKGPSGNNSLSQW